MSKRPRSPTPISTSSFTSSPDPFQSTPQNPWIRLPEDSIAPPPAPPYQSLRSKLRAIRQERNPQPLLPPKVGTTMGQHPSPTDSPQNRLIQILNSLSSDFTAQNRPYAALAASSAISLIQQGRQDDINAGLWQFITKKEAEMFSCNEKNDNPK